MQQEFTLKIKMAATIAIVLWASAFVGIRAGLQGYTPGGVALLRFAVAAVCMFFITFWLPPRRKISWPDKLYLLLIGALGLGFYNITLNYGELTVHSGIASFIISQSPIIIMILAVLFLKEKFNFYAAVGMVVSVVGIGLIMFGNTKDFSFNSGFYYILAATFLGAAYSILQKPFLQKYHAVEVTAYIIWGTALLLLYYLPDVYHGMHTAPTGVTMAVIYLGIFPAAIGYLAWSYALQAISASRLASFFYFIPVVATFLGWIFLNEIPTLLSLAGGMVALLGVWITNHASKKVIAQETHLEV
jgi:drug/metabolite transporter (DMT)-like permease